MQYSTFKSCSSFLYIAFLLKSQQTRVRYLLDMFMVIVMGFFSLLKYVDYYLIIIKPKKK